MTTTRNAAGEWRISGCRLRMERAPRLESAVLSFILLLPLLALAGCEKRGESQEAADAKAMVQTLKFNLNQAATEIANLKAELNAVQQTRDQLQEQIAKLIEDRDRSSAAAQQAQEAVTRLASRADGQVSTTAALEKQITELRALVEEQQKTIEQLQKGTAAEPIAAETPAQPPEQVPTPEPNQGGQP